MFLVLIIVYGVGILILAILLLEFVSFSDDKIVITDRRLFGIPIVKEYKISSFERVNISCEKGPYVKFYKKDKVLPTIVIELRDDIIEDILKYVPCKMLNILLWGTHGPTKKQLKLLYPYMDKEKQKEFIEKGYKQEDE